MEKLHDFEEECLNDLFRKQERDAVSMTTQNKREGKTDKCAPFKRKFVIFFLILLIQI